MFHKRQTFNQIGLLVLVIKDDHIRPAQAITTWDCLVKELSSQGLRHCFDQSHDNSIVVFPYFLHVCFYVLHANLLGVNYLPKCYCKAWISSTRL